MKMEPIALRRRENTQKKTYQIFICSHRWHDDEFMYAEGKDSLKQIVDNAEERSA
jgi:hypothetical protein